MQLLRKFRGANNEGSLALILLVVVLGMSLLNPVFFSVNTAFSILRAATVPMILALAVLLVIISGGIDVSFPVVAIGSAYTAVTICLKTGFDPGLPAIFGMAIVIGGLLGLVNGFVIAKFRLPTLIVTLGTQGIFFGAMLVYVGTRYYPTLPDSMAALSAVNVVELTTSAGRAYLHVLVLLSIAIALIIWAVLKYTMFGRSLYAIGGDVEGARRAGIRVMDHFGAGGHRLHAHGLQAAGPGRVEQGASDEGLADLGVGAGDEEGGHGRFSAISQKVS